MSSHYLRGLFGISRDMNLFERVRLSLRKTVGKTKEEVKEEVASINVLTQGADDISSTSETAVDEISPFLLRLKPPFGPFAWLALNALTAKHDEAAFFRIWETCRQELDNNTGFPLHVVAHPRQRVLSSSRVECVANTRFLQGDSNSFIVLHTSSDYKGRRETLINEVKEELREFLTITARGISLDSAPYSYLLAVLGCNHSEATLLFIASELMPFFTSRGILESGSFSQFGGIPETGSPDEHWSRLSTLTGIEAGTLERDVREGQLVKLKLLEINNSGYFPLAYKDGNPPFLRFNSALTTLVSRRVAKSVQAFEMLLRGRAVLPLDGVAWEDFAHVGVAGDVAASFLANPAARGGILLVGPPGCGKTEYAAQLVARAGRRCHAAGETRENHEENDSKDEATEKPDRDYRLASLRMTASMNRDAVILLDEAEDVLREPSTFGDRFAYSKSDLNRILENLPVPVIWTTNSLRDMDPATLRRMAMVITFPHPSAAVRERIWNRVLERTPVEGANAQALARQFDMSAGLLDTAARTAALSGHKAAAINTVLSGFARVMGGLVNRDDEDPEFDPELCEADTDVNALANRILESGYDDWSMCAYGPPGTGKSAFARYLAKLIGRKWILKRASDLMDKYLGESEKRIAEAFAAAKADGRMLIIDEVDSLLSSREGAKNSWEITQVNEMLTRMESHDLPFCATTNLMGRLDPATLRRFTFKVEFRNLQPAKLRLAFARIMGVDLPVGAALPDNMCAGDLASLRKRSRILGETDPGVLLDWLRAESDVKEGGRKNPIGFGG